MRDESTADVRIVLELKKDADPSHGDGLPLQAHPLQTRCRSTSPACPDGQPRRWGRPSALDLKKALRHFLDFRYAVVTSGLSSTRRAGEAHPPPGGFAKIYDAVDETIRIIRRPRGKRDAADKLMKRFGLDEEQVDAILELKLYRLARLEILVIQKELTDKQKEARRLASLLKSQSTPVGRW